MTMTVREAFERGGKGKPACLAFYSSWFGAFPDAHPAG
jgi:hypothetical protein